MKKLFVTLFIAFVAVSCSDSNSVDIVVANPINVARSGEIVEVESTLLSSKLGGAEQFVVRCAESGDVIASQLTYDGKLIFQSSVDAGAEAHYRVEVGEPERYEPLVFGKQYPERVDDFAWESDCIAFRTYGPALQASGERAFGYDVWVKNTTDLVVDRRYRKELDEGISYHVDHGDGLDCYKVGPTLGAGTTALMVDDKIVYPYCYKSYELLDDGPLRLTFVLEYNPIVVGEDQSVIERRVISIDAGSHLNKSLVTYSNLSKPATIITALVMQDKEGVADYSADLESGYISYATNQGKNGEIYVASITPQRPFASEAIYFDPEESRKLRGGAKGHVVSMSKYEPNSTYEYYWGAGWSRFKFKNHDEWQSYLKERIVQIESPLIITIK